MSEKEAESAAALRVRKIREFIFGRQRDYRTVFNPGSPSARVVLADLAKFCRATESTFHPDARAHALIEGRREVFLRIANHINLDSDVLYKMLTENQKGTG